MYNMVVRESLTKKVEFEQSFKRGKKVGEYLRWWRVQIMFNINVSLKSKYTSVMGQEGEMMKMEGERVKLKTGVRSYKIL